MVFASAKLDETIALAGGEKTRAGAVGGLPRREGAEVKTIEGGAGAEIALLDPGPQRTDHICMLLAQFFISGERIGLGFVRGKLNDETLQGGLSR